MRFRSKTFISGLFFLAAIRITQAQELEIEREGSSLAFTYVRPISAVVTVEQTVDFISWNAVDTFDQLLSQTTIDEIVRSSIAVRPDTRRLFLRLRIDKAWKVALTWDASPSQDVVGYCLHYGASPGNYSRHLDVGNVVRAAVPVPLGMNTCYFVVTAYNVIGLQSLPSRELKVRLHGKPKKDRRH